MRALLSTIGTRGEVQPLVALALRLRESGWEARLCAPPDFQEWVDSFGIPFAPIGPRLRATAAAGATRPTPEQLRQLAEASVAAQFAAVSEAARDCDVLVAGGALQFAAASVAEEKGIAYVYAAYCPVTLPSAHHAPPSLWGRAPAGGPVDNRASWAEDARRWNADFSALLNARRASAGLAPIADVRDHLFTDRPWLAADPVLAPWPGDPGVAQTGAWLLPDERPLPDELEAFLEAGEPPVYFGLGSMRVPEGITEVVVGAARALGRRAIVSRGWADLPLVDDGPDCLSIGEVNQRALFARVAAVVHHGGAGTTTAAALAGTPQVVLPQVYDQPYWAGRVRDLGIGTALAAPAAESSAAALSDALRPDVATRARSVATAMRVDGAEIAARQVVAMACRG